MKKTRHHQKVERTARTNTNVILRHHPLLRLSALTRVTRNPILAHPRSLLIAVTMNAVRKQKKVLKIRIRVVPGIKLKTPA